MKKRLFLFLCVVLFGISCKTVEPVSGNRSEAGSVNSKEKKQPEVIWKYDSGSKVRSSPVLKDQLVYSGSNDKFFAIHYQTGDIAWQVNTSAPVTSSCVVNDNKVYFECGEIIYVHSALTGEFLWKFEPEITNMGNYDEWDYHHPSPVIHDNNLFFGTVNGDLYVIDINTQKIVWQYKIDKISSTPVIYDNFIYLTNWDGSLYALDMDKREKVWDFETYGSIQTIPAVNGNYICFGSRDTNFYTLNRKTGEQLWKYTDMQESWFTGSPLLESGTIYAGSSDSKRLYAFDCESGEILWKCMTYGNVFSKPVIDGNKFYITSGDGYTTPGRGFITSADLDSGKPIWKFKAANIFTTPVIVDNIVIFGSDDGNLYALNINL